MKKTRNIIISLSLIVSIISVIVSSVSLYCAIDPSIFSKIFVANDNTQSTEDSQSTESSENNYLLMATVERVVDGDTIMVRTYGQSVSVRMIGINCPESVHPDDSKNSEEGVAASDFTKQLLPEGTVVYLEQDVSEADQYGRLLRYVWLQPPKELDSYDEIKKKMVNALLIENGYAQAVEYPPDTKYSDIFNQIESA